MKTISILGTGWLGYALASELKNEFNVKVSIRTNEKKEEYINEGLDPYLLNEEKLDFLDELLECDYLFINFPPSKFNNYLEFLNNIYSHKNISKVKKLIFISSTSIYPNEQTIFNEDFEIKNPISQKVYDAEVLIKSRTDVILRCSGLMGYNRIAGKYFAGKVVDSEDVKVNYVHRDDVISATIFTIKNDINGILNLCASSHPSRKEVYLLNAKKHNFEKPIFENKKEYKNRIIDGSKIERLGFEYKYPNPLEYY
ncbi:NAD(P)H-binding protein [Poseidonibacter lekithochrous]|uniref:NAD(P)H-binding protein n=1 Tax=Poseidonibacter lekithochrous TaxID=1904463 RepID=UPI0008FC7567|nr:NAD(P)H-binding protein [Poseidonibacter lekithochrous]QKJ23746.1 atypical short-chain dehydrogenase/reductase [Poseidonibacter lekithochrous]